jgi:MFS family permease
MSTEKESEEKIQLESDDENGGQDESHDDEQPRNHCCSTCLEKINKKRLVSKLFYFFFFSAFGSLWPYLALYFKQLFISPRQLGILVAIRSSLQFVFTPIWGAYADKYHKSKCVLLVGLCFWLVSTLLIAVIPSREKPFACYSINSIAFYANNSGNTSIASQLESQRDHVGHSYNDGAHWIGSIIPWGLGFFRSYESEKSVTFKEVPFPHFKTHQTPEPVADSSQLFIGLLVITIIGVMFASPTQCLADTATIQMLGKDTHEYGKQALWGSVGYGCTAFVVGASISGQKKVNPCSKEMNINYIPCFYVFTVYMFCATCVATRFKFQDSSSEGKCKPSILAGLKVLKDFDYAFFLFVVFFCGTATGFIQTFLFWHLRELGGEQILFSLITITNSTAEVVSYMFSDRFLCNIGHFKVIYLGLVCYSLRFFYYSYCSRPWLFLPIELIQGITTAAIWSSFVSYVGSVPGMASTLQGLVSGFYTGLGYATGGFVGGIMVHVFGSSTSFLVFGEMSLIVLFMFVIVNNVRTGKKKIPIIVLNQSKDFVSGKNDE